MLKRIFGKNKISILDILSMFVLLAVLVVFFYLNEDFSYIFVKNEAVDMGYTVARINDNNLIFIDRGKGRVTGIQDGNISFIDLSGGSEGSFYQAEDICIDESDGSYYILSVDWDESGYLLASERVLHYSPGGSYIETVYIEPYQPADEINRHKLFDIRFYNGNIEFIETNETSVVLKKVRNGEVIEEISYDYPDAWLYFQNFAHDEKGNIYGVDKRGFIYGFALNGNGIVYISPEEAKEVVFDVDIYKDKLFYIDIYHGNICQVESGSESKVLLDQRAVTGVDNNGIGANISSLQCYDEGISTIYNDEILLLDGNGNITERMSNFSKGSNFYFKNALAIVASILNLICVLYIIVRIVCYIVICKPKFSFVALLELSLILFTLVLTGGVIYGVSVPFRNLYLSSATRQLRDMAIMGANRFAPEWLDGIDGEEDFMNVDYAEMTNLLQAITTKSHDPNSRYGAEVDIIDEDGRAYALCYTDSSIGTYYPLDEGTKMSIQEIYDYGYTTESEASLAAGGTFLFGRAPIYRSDKIVGVLAIAQDNYRVMEMIQKNIVNILISVILGVIALIFLLNEGFALVPQIRNGRKLQDAATIGGKSVNLSALRILAFTISFVLNMTSSFLSVYTSSFWSESLGFSVSLAGAIPLFANAILVAVSSLFCPKLLMILGFQKLALLGLLLSAAGDFLAGLSRGYAQIVLALLLNGAGFGILLNSISITIGTVEQDDKRQGGYVGLNAGCVAGINSGMIFGSYVASALAYNKVFFVTTSLWVLQLLLFFKLGKEVPVGSTDEVVKDRRRKITNYPSKGIMYLVCMSIPFAIIGSFQYFYIPILSESLGYNEKYASLLMVIFAICGVIFGNILTIYMWERLERRAILVAFALAFISWLLISWTGDLRIIGVGMVILGISFSFGLNMLVNGYLGIKGMDSVGEDTAMSVYYFATGIGQSFSSIICGLILTVGMMEGMTTFVCICIGLLIIYQILSLIMKEKR